MGEGEPWTLGFTSLLPAPCSPLPFRISLFDVFFNPNSQIPNLFIFFRLFRPSSSTT